MDEAADQGRRLEQHVAAFFGHNGYSTRTNVVLQGRSGGNHEIDVLAQKSDAFTTFCVLVECKAWRQPIEKDVVSKVHYVAGDLGIHKTIVVCLGGCRSGAERAAKALGIELWGPDELRRHLGESLVTSLEVPARATNTTFAWGYPLSASSETAERVIRSTGKGRLGRVHEQLIWMAVIWLPAYVVRITVAVPEQRRRSVIHRSVTVDNLYEALSGSFIGRVSQPWAQVQMGQDVALPPSVRDTKVRSTLRNTFDGYARVSSPAAVDRHTSSLAALGLPTPCNSLTIDSTGLVYLPHIAGVLESQSGQRVVAVDGRTGFHSEPISQVLTAQISVLRTHLSSH